MPLTSKMTGPKDRFHSRWKFPGEKNLTDKMNLTDDYETSLSRREASRDLSHPVPHLPLEIDQEHEREIEGEGEAAQPPQVHPLLGSVSLPHLWKGIRDTIQQKKNWLEKTLYSDKIEENLYSLYLIL